MLVQKWRGAGKGVWEGGERYGADCTGIVQSNCTDTIPCFTGYHLRSQSSASILCPSRNAGYLLSMVLSLHHLGIDKQHLCLKKKILKKKFEKKKNPPLRGLKGITLDFRNGGVL